MLTEEVTSEITEVIQETLPEAFVVEMKMKRGPSSSLVIKVDTDKGISMAECARISRAVGALVDEKSYFEFSFNLELSSPGIGSPLLLHRQYVNNIGRHLKIKMEEGKELKGKLEAVEEDHIVLLPVKKKLSKSQRKKGKQVEEPSEYKIAFSDMLEAKVIII